MKREVEVRGVRIGEGIPKICVPVAERSTEEILAAAVAMRGGPYDIVEWRADWFNGVRDPAAVLEALHILREALGVTPLLFTFRTEAEGGERAFEPAAYFRLFQTAVHSKMIDLADAELSAGEDRFREMVQSAHDCGVAVVGSSHDFCGTPEKEVIISRLCRMQELGADLLKIAVMPRSAEDVLTLLGATREMSEKYAERPLITMAMGGIGGISRISGELFGSAVTFGTAGKASAPGQLPAGVLSELLRTMHEYGMAGS